MKVFNYLIRLIIFIFGILGFIGFIVPLLRRRILNVGNMSGLFICTCFMFYAIFMPKIHNIIRTFWQRTLGKAVLSILAIGLVFGVVLVIVMTSFMIKASVKKPAPNATVIVLGCKVYGENPSLMLAERLKAALKYLNENPSSACVVSGGQGKDEDISEAECMYTWLIKNGISPERIYKEDKSTTTRENLAFSYEIIKEHGLNESIAIATNDFHEYRAGMHAANLGLDCGAVSGNTLPWLLPTYYARELLAILYEWVF